MSSGLSSASTPAKSPSPNAASKTTPSQSAQPQVIKPTPAPAPTTPAAQPTTPAAQPTTPATPQITDQITESQTTEAPSQFFASDSEQIVKWLILALIPVGAVGAALYCLRPPARPKPMNLRTPDSAPSLPEAQLPAEARTTPDHTQFQPPNAQVSNPAAEATVSVGSSSELARTTRISKVDIVEALITDLHHSEVAQRRKSIWELGQRGDSRAIQPLVDLLVDADSQQRSLILAAIAEISNRALKPMHRALLISLQDESADVRKNAIRDITRIYDQMAQVSQLLQYAASDTDPDVQETAQWALGQFNRFRTAPEELKPARPDELPRSRDPRLGDSQRL